MKPYYQDAWATIYHGDCSDVLPEISPVDAVVTDPPYGIQADVKQKRRAGKKHGKAWAASTDYGDTAWDERPPTVDELASIIGMGRHAIIWGGNYFTLPPSPGWLVWDKDNGTNNYADCELAWTNLNQPVRKIRYRWHGMLQEHGGRHKERRVHPTQKPVAVMAWCIKQAVDKGGIILDPYMGSGSILRAASNEGVRSIGIEKEERYCEIAAERLAQCVLW